MTSEILRIRWMWGLHWFVKRRYIFSDLVIFAIAVGVKMTLLRMWQLEILVPCSYIYELLKSDFEQQDPSKANLVTHCYELPTDNTCKQPLKDEM